MGSRRTLFLKSKSSSVAQVVKYIMCGGFSVLVDQVTFYLLAWSVLPALRPSDPIFRLIEWLGFSASVPTEAELKQNYWVIKGICFIVSNSVVYLLNVLFVFEGGRHRRSIEVLLFFGSSLFQFFFIWLGGILITTFHWEVTYSNITMLIVAMLVNFVIRKKVVFKR